MPSCSRLASSSELVAETTRYEKRLPCGSRFLWFSGRARLRVRRVRRDIPRWRRGRRRALPHPLSAKGLARRPAPLPCALLVHPSYRYCRCRPFPFGAVPFRPPPPKTLANFHRKPVFFGKTFALPKFFAIIRDKLFFGALGGGTNAALNPKIQQKCQRFFGLYTFSH